MSYRHTLEAAMESLYEVEDIVKTFPKDKSLPVIEIDLILQKIRNLYELMLMLKKEGSAATQAPAEMPAEAKEAEATPPAPGVSDAVTGKIPQPSPKTGKASATRQTLGDQFKGSTTLHEHLHQNFNRESETLAHVKPVANLLAAIGINDRYTFIRELFDNDTAAFEHSIQLLNEASSFNDAYNYMIQQFDWDMDGEPVQQLLDLVRRRFIKGKHE
jgi:hypothetical protein